VPFRLEVGPRDVAAGQGVLVRRTDRAKEPLPLDGLAGELPGRLADYQAAVFQRALEFRAANTHHVDDYDTFRQVIEGEGGFLMAHWCGDAGCEARISEETGATLRVIPFDAPEESGRCVADGRPSEQRVLVARAD
jgi:prolyl-tRNA synthetase